MLQLELSADLVERLRMAALDAGEDPEEFALVLLDAVLSAAVPAVQEGEKVLTYRKSPSVSRTWDSC